MIIVTIQYTEDCEMIEAHCLKSEIQKYASEIKVINPEGETEAITIMNSGREE